MFSLPQLEAFVAVAEELHFGAAAERLNMTQPPLSRQIQMLEKKLGTQLFGRTSRKVELTAAGATLLPRARQILDMCIKTDLDVRRVSSGQAGAITVGYTAIAGQSALPLMLRRAAEGMPGVSFVLRELVSTDQMDGLVKGQRGHRPAAPHRRPARGGFPAPHAGPPGGGAARRELAAGQHGGAARRAAAAWEPWTGCPC